MDIKGVLKEELKRVSLNKEEILELNKLAEEILLKLRKIGVRAFIGGSLAKNTLIRKNIQDIDIFVVFENEKETGKLEGVLKKAGLEAKVVHGSRDYLHIQKGNIIFELIPVVKFKTPEEAENVTDFSLLHVDYVKKKINKKPKIAEEIKLAKVFCYAQNCYGAESYIKGFSGYALELLVINFGSFAGFLKNIIKLAGKDKKEKIVIDSEKQFKNKQMILSEINESKLSSPIVLIDPTYKYRNVCAGLSDETFGVFIEAAKIFLKRPSLDFFEFKKFDEKRSEKIASVKKAKLIKIKLETSKQEGDIAATKMKKFFEFMINEFEKKEQKVIDKEFVYDNGQEAKGYLILKENNEILVRGPKKEMKEAVKSFKLVHKKVAEKAGFVWAKKKISLEEIFAYLHRFEDEMAVRFKLLD